MTIIAENIIRAQRDIWARPDGDPTSVRVCDVLLGLIAEENQSGPDERVRAAVEAVMHKMGWTEPRVGPSDTTIRRSIRFSLSTGKVRSNLTALASLYEDAAGECKGSDAIAFHERAIGVRAALKAIESLGGSRCDEVLGGPRYAPEHG